MLIPEFTQWKEHEGASSCRCNRDLHKCLNRNRQHVSPSVPPCNSCTKTSSNSPRNPHIVAPGCRTSNGCAFGFWPQGWLWIWWEKSPDNNAQRENSNRCPSDCHLHRELQIGGISEFDRYRCILEWLTDRFGRYLWSGRWCLHCQARWVCDDAWLDRRELARKIDIFWLNHYK